MTSKAQSADVAKATASICYKAGEKERDKNHLFIPRGIYACLIFGYRERSMLNAVK
ncbi:MAG: hypothetical protein IPO07_12690 [Haliscomenobacter sp.]|nr:hypothetical protein [Haliscomenobacter sp.]